MSDKYEIDIQAFAKALCSGQVFPDSKLCNLLSHCLYHRFQLFCRILKKTPFSFIS